MEQFSNVSYIPSAMDLLLVVPRLAQRASSFALFHMPEAVDNIASKVWNGGSVLADPTSSANATISNTSAAFVQTTASTLEATLREAFVQGEETSSFLVSVAHGFGKLKNFGGIFSYLTSKWALTTFTVAIILNRTQFYASSREHLRLRFHVRLALYLIPIAAILVQLLSVLQALKCQTSPNFAQLRYGDPLKHLTIDFASEGGFLYKLSSALLFWQDDAECCNARHMSLLGVGEDKTALRGSMSMLYWFFLTLCTSQLFETLACALQGKQPMPETGMTIFEHSLAFAECEAMISSALGFGFLGLSKGDSPSSSSDGPLISRAEILQRLNVPPEVLLVCLISCFSHLSSALLAVAGIRHNVRLINTAVWGCCYMSAIVWSFAKIFMYPVDHISDLGVLRFPTVCIVGFIPHLLLLIGTLICAFIYGLAILATVISMPKDAAAGRSIRQRLEWAYQNLQANVQFSQNSSIRIKMTEDFYTTLLKVGFNVLTAASEAVYLNEGSRINVANMTWLEQKRIDELALSMDKRKGPSVPVELLGDGIARGVNYVDHQNFAIGQSPYARERKSQTAKIADQRRNQTELDSGLGISQRRSRMQLTFDFIAGILWLAISVQAQFALSLLRKVGIEQRPSWLLKAAGLTEKQRKPSAHTRSTIPESTSFYLLGADGSLTLPDDSNVDVEVETRRKMMRQGKYQDEQHLSDKLYQWWQKGGWFGDLDASGDYVQTSADNDDDTTSMISMSTNASTNDDWEEEESGRRTPTQRDFPGDHFSREGTPAMDSGLDMGSLSRLLNPKTAADREEARLLSYSLQSQRPMTRSQYRRNQDRTRAELLAGLRNSSTSVAYAGSEEDEERDLEQFILAQRSKAKTRAQRAGTWEAGAEGMGEGGPQCVVCQSTPRTILVWPCGCLSMCDDCRVGLAARNYTKCICCRTDIAAYSRLYVP
ncbi:Protein ASI3 [Pseudocercospora fuligena]|uniref:Protein ASI3 n=1 Tax=Pseudocercospora fuligena TaxID=685502 RepID=A0A8H6VIP5_9PEZI|nr:Protein ASI3 [Pseudocercospora fuligena]